MQRILLRLEQHRVSYPKLLKALNRLLGFASLILVLVLVRDVVSFAVKKEVRGATASRSLPKSKEMSFQDYAPVVRNNPFGAPAGELKLLSASAGAFMPRPDISGLRLVGTVSGAKAQSYAIFAGKDNQQEIVKVGAAVPGYGVLQRVERDKVIVLVNGNAVELQMADTVALTDSGPAQSTAAAPFAKAAGEGAYIVDQKKILQAIERPNQIMTDARLLPYAAGNRQGFVLNEVKQGGIYQSLGLQNGDVLLRINDYNISDPERALQAFTALRGMDRVQLDIVRNGATMTMTYQIR